MVLLILHEFKTVKPHQKDLNHGILFAFFFEEKSFLFFFCVTFVEAFPPFCSGKKKHPNTTNGCHEFPRFKHLKSDSSSIEANEVSYNAALSALEPWAEYGNGSDLEPKNEGFQVGKFSFLRGGGGSITRRWFQSVF